MTTHDRHYEGGTTEVICLSRTINTKIALLLLAMMPLIVTTPCYDVPCHSDRREESHPMKFQILFKITDLKS